MWRLDACTTEVSRWGTALRRGSCVGPSEHCGVMSSSFVISPADQAADPAAGFLTRQGVGVWCDRAILGHGVVAVVGRRPQLGAPVWIGDGLHEPPREHHLRELAVLVAAWDGPRVWPAVSEWVPLWLASGASVVLVAPTPQAGEVELDRTHPQLRWCSPRASASDLLAAVEAGVAGASSRRPEGVPRTLGRNRLSRAPALSEREQRVLELITTGLKVSAVARRMDVSPHTVHTYLRRIRRKFAEAGTPVASPLEMYRAASLWRLIAEPSNDGGGSHWTHGALGSTG